jgi:hypothetical protein
VDQVEQYLQPLVRLLERGFERAYALKQMLFERWLEQGFDAAISREGRRTGYNHQLRAARRARLAVIRIGMSALLTEYHFIKPP